MRSLSAACGMSSAQLDPAAKPEHHVAMPLSSARTDSPPSLEGAILALCNEAGSGRTICPTDAAQAFAAARGEDALGWRSHLSQVRGAAVRLAEAGRIVIYRKGKPVDPRDFRGVYRLGLPRSD
jgi:hypothetical protein